jgi:serine/threonine protein kinase
MAPEVVKQTGHDFAADTWSLGVSAIELAQGQAPFNKLKLEQVLDNLSHETFPKLQDEEDWDDDFVDFVKDCIQKEPINRPTLDELLKKHKKFFAKAKTPAYLKQHFIQEVQEVSKR